MNNLRLMLAPWALVAAALLLPAATPGPASATTGSYSGRVLDAATETPIESALVTVGSTVSRTDREGRFQITGEGSTLAIRAVGHRRSALPAEDIDGKPTTIRLPPLAAKALYLSVYGIGNRGMRTAALKLIRETDLNALVIDVKGDKGLIPFKTALPLALQTGAHAVTTVRDMPELMQSLRASGIYLIARIVVFKDAPLALARPDWAVRTHDGEVWLDREDLAWIDPFRREAWPYTIDIAVEAARLGFDEIQFDYIRFPDTGGLVFSQPSSEASRVQAITGFLTAARSALVPYNVFLSADVFGYVLWNQDDTHIGQKLEVLPDLVDYLSPMLYPTTFHLGIPGYRVPVQNPYAIVSNSLKNAQQRLRLAPNRFRPWLQAFRDYAFDRRQFGPEQVSEQIRAAEEFGSGGWMLWNPLNRYEAEGIAKRIPIKERAAVVD
jgi:hypothetical protein